MIRCSPLHERRQRSESLTIRSAVSERRAEPRLSSGSATTITSDFNGLQRPHEILTRIESILADQREVLQQIEYLDTLLADSREAQVSSTSMVPH